MNSTGKLKNLRAKAAFQPLSCESQRRLLPIEEFGIHCWNVLL